jgi:hypothetical protein
MEFMDYIVQPLSGKRVYSSERLDLAWLKVQQVQSFAAD